MCPHIRPQAVKILQLRVLYPHPVFLSGAWDYSQTPVGGYLFLAVVQVGRRALTVSVVAYRLRYMNDTLYYLPKKLAQL